MLSFAHSQAKFRVSWFIAPEVCKKKIKNLSNLSSIVQGLKRVIGWVQLTFRCSINRTTGQVHQTSNRRDKDNRSISRCFQKRVSKLAQMVCRFQVGREQMGIFLSSVIGGGLPNVSSHIVYLWTETSNNAVQKLYTVWKWGHLKTESIHVQEHRIQIENAKISFRTFSGTNN